MKSVATRYDNLFEVSSLTPWASTTARRAECPFWHFHAHYYRRAALGHVRKFMVGYEMLATAARHHARSRGGRCVS